jgi:hypothetical protein
MNYISQNKALGKNEAVDETYRGPGNITLGQRFKEAIQNNMNTFAWSFDRWLRCSLFPDRCGYAPRSRLASGQNPGAPVVHVILNSLLIGEMTTDYTDGNGSV